MWRRADPGLDRETVDGIIGKPMVIDDKLDWIVEYLRSDGDDAEEDES